MLYVRAAIVLAIVVGTAWVTHRVELGRYDALELKYDQIQAAAVTAAQVLQSQEDAAARAADIANASAQQQIISTSQLIVREIPNHVTAQSIPCMPLGLVRLLDAAALGVDPSSLPLAPGKSDASCAPIDADALAGSIISNYGIAWSNAKQLDALNAELSAVKAITPRN